MSACRADSLRLASQAKKCNSCRTTFSPGQAYYEHEGGVLCQPCMERRRPKCKGCSLPLSGSVVSAGEFQYHAACFCCGTCGKQIAGAYRSEDSGQVTCGICVEESLPKCAGCQRPLKGKYCTVSGASYHPECFTCKVCRRTIPDSFFPSESGGFMCPKCAEASQPKVICCQCNRPIKGQCMQDGNGEKYHPACFACSSCRRPLDGPFITKDGGRLCLACQPKCAVCGKSLAGKSYTCVGGVDMHTACVACSLCKVHLKDGFFKLKTGGIGCQTCHLKEVKVGEMRKERAHIESELRTKRSNTHEFTLYWREDLVPSNRDALQMLRVNEPNLLRSPHVSLHFDRRTLSVRCVPTDCSAASTNISYLACALKVLTKEKCSPRFSLDPKDPLDIQGSQQVKAFYPPWLAGTIFGEVLFQADYALKELCFGDRALPGLPALFDDADALARGEPQAARQWFVVRSARVEVSADGCLVPEVKLGVEARRLVKTPQGFRDADVTDEREPAVRFARAFTARFDEAAKALPVVGELLSAARAVVLARFLLENGARVDKKSLEAFVLPHTPESCNGGLYPLEIPTLTKTRTNSDVRLQDGGVQIQATRQTMSGGVDLGVKTQRVEACKAGDKGALLKPEVKVAWPGARAVNLPLFALAAAAA
eukprot:TRINITY_DN1701_c0_g2_i1.p1 TRINITY_DN1701_c0_g2~~TRINITY_DN1701_c0_g2_i1.p1  ORF type:complete len:653 (+),score=85.48 TRINITY_DN1701_c0_g2_i1:25-1983(+)